MSDVRTASSVRRLAAREWLLLLALLASLAAGLGWRNGVGRPDQEIYDTFVSAQTRAARDDIVIVAIDDYSLSQLGRWPWPRTVHAQLIDRLSAARPAAIGLDVILSEPSMAAADGDRSGDDALAAALARSRKVVLPVTTGSVGDGSVVRLPVDALARRAGGLGHIGLNPDRDGVVRSVYLREGAPGHWWPQFAAALLTTGSGAASSSPILPASLSSSLYDAAPDRRWQGADRIRVPFAGGVGHFRSIPYVAALRGEVPNDFFAGKYVLVGATAAGLADGYPTPVSGTAGTMPGIEIHANVLASLLDHRHIDDARPWQTALLGILAVTLAMLGYLRLSPRAALLWVSALTVAVVATSYAALAAGVWIAPTAALLALALSYPLWSWRRLEAAMRYLDQEFRRLDHEPHLLPETGTARPRAATVDDLLARRIDAMADAARRVRDLRQFISDSLDSLPDATLVTTVDGHVLLANRQAIAYFDSIGLPQVHDALLPYLFSTLHFPQPIAADDASERAFEWWHLIDPGRRDALGSGISVQDRQDRDLLIKSAPCQSAHGQLIGWIVSIADISAIRAAERSHDETV
ncbi:MAG: CHASE2 domain-containing protein, partial [Burkholderiaceae bacterium]